MDKILRINAFSNWAGLLVNIIIGFYVTRIIAHQYGSDGYGLWTLVSSFVGYYGLLNLGIRSAVTRYIARYTAQENHLDLNRVASTSFSVFIAAGLVVIAVSFLLSTKISTFFALTPGQNTVFVSLVRILGLATSLEFFGMVYSATLVARERFVLINSVAIGSNVLRFLLILLVIRSEMSLVGVGYATLTSSFLSLVAYRSFFKIHAADIIIRLRDIQAGTLKELSIYGSATFIIMIADILRNQIDSVVIGHYLSMSAVGIYGCAALLKQYMTRIVSTGMVVLGPRFAALDGIAKHKEKDELLFNGIFIASFISFLGLTMLLTIGGNIIDFWMGEAFRDSNVILYLLAASSAFAVAQSPSISYMYAINKHVYYAAVTLSEGLLNLIISLLLVVRYGIIGVAMGTVLSMMLVKVVVMPIYMSRIANVSLWHYSRHILFFSLISFSLAGVFHLLGFRNNLDLSFFSILLVALCQVALYFSITWLLMRKKISVLFKSIS